MTIAEQFASVAEGLIGRDAAVERRRMLQAPGLRNAGHFFAFVTTSDLVVKLPPKHVVELIGSGVGRPCEIRRGAPMRDWVRLSLADVRTCASYVIEARDFVVSQKGR
jgi:hypothetical protein